MGWLGLWAGGLHASDGLPFPLGRHMPWLGPHPVFRRPARMSLRPWECRAGEPEHVSGGGGGGPGLSALLALKSNKG